MCFQVQVIDEIQEIVYLRLYWQSVKRSMILKLLDFIIITTLPDKVGYKSLFKKVVFSTFLNNLFKYTNIFYQRNRANVQLIRY